MHILHYDDYAAAAQRVSDYLKRLAARPNAPQCLGTLNAGTDSVYSLSVSSLATLADAILATNGFKQGHGRDPADVARCKAELVQYMKHFLGAAKASGVKRDEDLLAMPIPGPTDEGLVHLDLYCIALGEVVARRAATRQLREGPAPWDSTVPQGPADAAVLEAARRADAYLEAYGECKGLDREEITRVYTVADECPLLVADLRLLAAAARAPGAVTGVVQIDNASTTVNLDFESSAARGLVDVVKALSEAGAPLSHPDGQLMGYAEQIAWLGQRAALYEQQRAALSAVLAEIDGNSGRPATPNGHLPADVVQQVRDALAAGDAPGQAPANTPASAEQ